jgi:hypothetical protein
VSKQHAWSIGTILFAVAIFFFCNTVGHALTFDFVGPDADKWFNEFVNHPNIEMGGGDAGWHITENGLTTDDDLGTGHQRIGFSEDWTDYTLESKYQYVQQGAHQEAHLYIRWNSEADNYYFRTIGRINGGGAGSGYSIEWLRKVGGGDSEGDITDDDAIVGDLQEGVVYGLRGTITGETLDVEFYNGGQWHVAGSVDYDGANPTGGIGVARATAQIAWEYLKVNGPGIPADADTTSVESLNKLATTWGKLKKQ